MNVPGADGIDLTVLADVLKTMFGKEAAPVSHRAAPLRGGTLGDVRLITGFAKTSCCGTVPYELVCKTQGKWERPGDPGSWRREYDLYDSDLESFLTGALRRPECYLSEIGDDAVRLWMEYAGGVSGAGLAVEMLEKAATELGRLQGRIYSANGRVRGIGCASDAGYMRRDLEQWYNRTYSYDFLYDGSYPLPEHVKRLIGKYMWDNGRTIEYNILRLDECGVPAHLKKMITDLDGNTDEAFKAFQELSVVFCHRDFWTGNIIFEDGKITLIDWDTAGWGYLGEDIASLIADETAGVKISEYFRRFVPAYLEGVSGYMGIPRDFGRHIKNMIVIKFGYRVAQAYMFAESEDARDESISILQGIYDLWGPK